MNYTPSFTGFRRKGHFPIGNHLAALFVDIVSPSDSIQYAFILAVFGEDEEVTDPCLYVASEENTFGKYFPGAGSHILTVFDDEGHTNHGSSDDWADESKFLAAALRIVRDRFGGGI